MAVVKNQRLQDNKDIRIKDVRATDVRAGDMRAGEIRTSNGRIYDVVRATVWECKDTEVSRFCAVQLVERGVEYSSWEFVFRFYHSFQPASEHATPLDLARRWIIRYLEADRQPLPPSQRGRAIVVECR
jgi:hypothetical protein